MSLEEPGRLKPGRTVEYIVWDREWKLFWGSPPPSRGEVRRIKVTDGPTVVGRGTCIPVCTEGGGRGEGTRV